MDVAIRVGDHKRRGRPHAVRRVQVADPALAMVSDNL
jgi:hypothetical protein